MRPSIIPDREAWQGARRIVMAPPDGDLTNDKIRPLEMVAELHEGVPVYSARCVLEPGDLDTLSAGGTVWLTFYGGVMPFSVTVAEAG
ncbi:MAG: hypothetical protein ACJ72N_06930 [Labedaea sp.]